MLPRANVHIHTLCLVGITELCRVTFWPVFALLVCTASKVWIKASIITWPHCTTVWNTHWCLSQIVTAKFSIHDSTTASHTHTLRFTASNKNRRLIFLESDLFKSNISYPPDNRINTWWALIFCAGLFSSCSNMPSMKNTFVTWLLPSKTGQGRAVNLLQLFVLLAWHKTLYEC